MHFYNVQYQFYLEITNFIIIFAVTTCFCVLNELLARRLLYLGKLTTNVNKEGLFNELAGVPYRGGTCIEGL